MGYCMIDTLICLSMHDIFILFVVPHFGSDVIDATLPRNTQVAFALQTVIAYTQQVYHGFIATLLHNNQSEYTTVSSCMLCRATINSSSSFLCCKLTTACVHNRPGFRQPQLHLNCDVHLEPRDPDRESEWLRLCMMLA